MRCHLTFPPRFACKEGAKVAHSFAPACIASITTWLLNHYPSQPLILYSNLQEHTTNYPTCASLATVSLVLSTRHSSWKAPDNTRKPEKCSEGANLTCPGINFRQQ